MYRHIDADIVSLMLAVALYMNIGTAFRKGTMRDRRFLNCVLMLLLLLIADIGACMAMEAPVGRAVFLSALTIYNACLVLTVIAWLHYLIELIYGDRAEVAMRLRRISIAPYFVYLALLLYNLRDGLLFSCDADGALAHGPLFFLPATLYGAYTVWMVVVVVSNRNRIVSAKLRRLLLVMPLLTAAGVWVQSVADGWLTIAPFYGVGVFIAYLFIQESRTRRMLDSTKTIVQTLSAAADTDEMTGLLNRSASMRHIADLMEHACDRGCALLLLDVDRFKRINDTLGHVQGDGALQAFAAALKSHFRSSDIVGRLGGDEFVVFLPNMADAEKLRSILLRLLERIATIYAGENGEMQLSASIGVVMDDMGGENVMSLYTKADEALYYVKRHGKNGFAFYDASFQIHVERPGNESIQTERIQ